MLYEISAMRSDGLHCAGTVDCVSEKEAIKECRRTFRVFTVSAKGIVHCMIHSTKACYEHTGEKWSFSGHSVKVRTDLDRSPLQEYWEQRTKEVL